MIQVAWADPGFSSEPLTRLAPTPADLFETAALEIAAAVAAMHRTTVDVLKSDRNDRRITLARQHAIYEIYKNTDAALATVGKIFNRGHTAARHGVLAHEARNGLQPSGKTYGRIQIVKMQRAYAQKTYSKAK